MKTYTENPANEILTYSVAVIALCALICFAAYKLEESHLAILAVFTPSLVALVLTVRSKGRRGLYDLFVTQTVRRTAFKWLLVSIAGIPILVSLAVLSASGFDVSGFSLRTSSLMPQMVLILLIALGEEYGWRGFLLPRLMNRFSAFRSNVILGLICGFWHFPAYLIGTGVPLEMNLAIFLLWVVLGALFIGWLYYYTRSVLTSILAHMGANSSFNYLYLLPEFTGSMDTFWFFLLYLLLIVVTAYFLGRKDLFDTSGVSKTS